MSLNCPAEFAILVTINFKMATLIRTDAVHPEFLELVKLLDIDLQLRDGEEHYFFAQFNTTEGINQVVVAYDGEIAVGCGALKQFAEGVMEVKRMFVREDYRGQGIAAAILHELESWALELSAMRCILETGVNQPEAIRLYEKCLYHRIPNFGPYKDVASSVCFEKSFISG